MSTTATAVAPPATSASKVDRATTTPFLLKLFYKVGSFHRQDDFTPTTTPSQHLQIYTWPTCTLSELALLLSSALPSLLPDPAAGTRIAFRLVFPDTRPHVANANANGGNAPGRFLSKELGSVVLGEGATAAARDENAARNGKEGDVNGADDVNGEEKGEGEDGNEGGKEKADAEDSAAGSTSVSIRDSPGEPTRALNDARFVIGDYVLAAILLPLANGSVAPAPAPPAPNPSTYPRGGGYGGPPRGGGNYGGPRENGHGHGYGDSGYGGSFRGRGPRGGGGGGGHGGGGGVSGGFGEMGGRGGMVPSGEWRRGEHVPDGYGGGYRGDRGGYRGRGRGW